MYREVFNKFLKDISKFNQNELTIVTYDKSTHTLIFRQMNQIVLATYLSPFFLPLKNFKIGVLTQSGLNKLVYNLNNLLGTEKLDNEELIPDLNELGTNWYYHYKTKEMPIPQVTISLKYVNITNRFFTWLLCRFYNNNSKIIYKAVKNEWKLMHKPE